MDLQNKTFVKAARDASPPKMSEHWAYLKPGRNPDRVGGALTQQLDSFLSMATEVMDSLDWR